MKKLILIILSVITTVSYAQDGGFLEDVFGKSKYAQLSATQTIEENSFDFGASGTTVESFEFYIDSQSKSWLFRSKFNKDVIYDDYSGRTFYDVNIENQVVLSDVSGVYESGNKLYLTFKKYGDGWAVRTDETGYWSKYVFHKTDIPITIYDDKIRDKVLNAFKYLIKYPYKLQD